MLSEQSHTLEDKCPYCYGKGESIQEGSGRRLLCEMCNGSGYVPTEFGERVLALMRHNFKPMLEDAGG